MKIFGVFEIIFHNHMFDEGFCDLVEMNDKPATHFKKFAFHTMHVMFTFDI